jgi:cell division protease FtsH
LNKNLRTVLLYLVLLVAAVYFVTGTFGAAEGPAELTTSEFLTSLDEDRVTEVTFKVNDRVVEGQFYETEEAVQEGETALKPFTSTWAGEDSFNELMAENTDVEFAIDPQNTSLWVGLLTSLLPIGILILVMLYFFSQMQGGNSKVMSFRQGQGQAHDARSAEGHVQGCRRGQMRPSRSSRRSRSSSPTPASSRRWAPRSPRAFCW